MPSRGAVRLAAVAASVWAVCLAAVHAPEITGALATVLWCCALGAVAIAARTRRRTRRGRLAAAVIVLALAGSAAAASHVAFAQPPRAALEDPRFGGGRAITVSLEATGKIERRSDGLLAFDARTVSITAGDETRHLAVDITVAVELADVDDIARLDVGARVTARGVLQPAWPGERAAARILASRGIEIVRAPQDALATAAALRSGLVSAVAGLPGDGAGLVPGLAVGDTTAVSSDLDAAMKASSLSHLTAVSGANCAIVVGIAVVLAALLGAGRRVRVACGLAALAGFVLLVTPEPSVVRAAVMAAIAMLGLVLGRPSSGLAILAVAVVVVLVGDPWLAPSLGFALSVTATASLLLFARPLADGLTRVLPRALALALAVPLAAQLACGPLLILITPDVPLAGVLANLLAAPAAPVATIVGLAACLAAPLPAVQSGLAAIAWLPASWIAGTARTVSALPGATATWIEGWAGAVILALVGAALGIVIGLGRGRSRARERVRWMALLALATVVGIVAGSSALAGVAGRWTLPSQWSILACDVGQGDAVLVRSAGAIALIDTGPDPKALDACLARAGIVHIDLLVLTHFDADHVGGLEAVAGRVGTVLHGPPGDGDDAILGALEGGGADLLAADTGATGALGDARWHVLWPQAASRAFPPGNDASVVLEIRGGAVPAVLLLGDLSASPQRAIAASGLLARSYAVVKVAHHGSADQHAALYRAVQPSIGLITVGSGNDYGHPRAEVLAELDALGARIARTDRDGMVAVWSVGDEAALWRERGGVGRGG
ncbi:ComEC/Rec2 family competence protein [Microbacterium sp. 2FI]|uniref:ComEC/Rec2 family competence protein n=1 Tax=Microbacterium sp. 2FI TaxID=2502193 RepID=UPI0010F7CF55|nr:ComEC/Rec2 family competence protein [Microbacterium sp. 2FI]